MKCHRPKICGLSTSPLPRDSVPSGSEKGHVGNILGTARLVTRPGFGERQAGRCPGKKRNDGMAFRSQPLLSGEDEPRPWHGASDPHIDGQR